MDGPENVENLMKMSKSVRKCQNLTKNVHVLSDFDIFRQILTFFLDFRHFRDRPFGIPPKCHFDIFLTFSGGSPGDPFWTLQNAHLTFFRHFPRGPKSTSPGPHLTFFFDCVGHFPGTIQNRHFDIFFTFSGNSGNTPVTLGSAHYGSK